MPYKYRLIILFVIALVASWIVFKPLLKIAKGKNIVDNPDARKLQKEPIPVMGGIAVFFGIVVGLSFYKTMINFTSLFPVLSAMVIMLYLGSIDDILNLNPKVRFSIEIIVSLLLLYGLKVSICNFQGLFGIDAVSSGVAIFLSVLTFVGVCNAINMIDGIDGLSSSFCILIMGCLGIICFLAHLFSYAAIAAVSIGAILPFFIHNVFGKKTKMFIGDGGTLMMGTMISALIFVILSDRFVFPLNPEWDFSRIAFVIAVLSVPVADTLRVMALRVLQHKSPFAADKNHTHHILLKLGFSCTAITAIEIVMDIIVILAFFISWFLGASVNVQFIIVIAVAASINWVLVSVLNCQIEKDTKFARKLRNLASKTQIDTKSFWLKIQKLVDKE